MKKPRARKQVANRLREVGITLWDKKTRSELTVHALDLLIEYIEFNKTDDEFAASIEVLRFVRIIDDFVLENKSDNKEFEFYAQHKKEIDKDKNKALVFQKKFKIVDPVTFRLEFKKKDWYLPVFYDDKLRDDIISAQRYKCAMCNEDVSGINPHLHHIDYDKTNCSRINLAFVCPRCHGKTNSNRPFWKKLLVERQEEILDG